MLRPTKINKTYNLKEAIELMKERDKFPTLIIKWIDVKTGKHIVITYK